MARDRERNVQISLPALLLPRKANVGKCLQPALPQGPVGEIRGVVLNYRVDAFVQEGTGTCVVVRSAG